MGENVHCDVPLVATPGADDCTTSGGSHAEGTSAAEQFLRLLSPYSVGSAPSALKKEKKDPSRRPHFDTTLHIVEAPECGTQSETSTGELSEESDSSCSRKLSAVEEVGLSNLPEPELIKAADITVTERPPLWVRRFSELSLLLNSTRRRDVRGCTVVDAVRDQLSNDVAAAQSLRLAVECDRQKRAVGDGREGDQLLACDAERMTAEFLPPWRREGAKERMMEALLKKLQGWLRIVSEDSDVAGCELGGRVVDIEESDGSNGIVPALFCPALKRVHVCVVQKSLINDLVASSANVWNGRARRISEGIGTQTPMIHSENVSDESIRPVYCLSSLRYLGEEETPVSTAENRPQGRRSFVIHIDYLRFRPLNSKHAGSAGGHWETTCSGGPEGSVTMAIRTPPVRSGGLSEGNEVRIGPTVVTFNLQDELISSILDNYEPYRMMELNLLPQLKSGRFYEDQLQSLRRQRNPSCEQREMATALTNLHGLTCKLEQSYVSGMVRSWKQLLRVRGGNCEGVSLRRGQPETEGSTHGASSVHVLPPGVSQGHKHDDFGSSSGSPATLDVPTSMLINPVNVPAAEVGAGFRLQFVRGSVTVDADRVGDGDLRGYSPVIWGLTTRAVGEEIQTERFRILIFARIRAFPKPQFVGATEPRVINSEKVVFFNETFELHTFLDADEILLHIVTVGGNDDCRVVSTIRIKPPPTQACLLLPMQESISFTHSGRCYKKCGGDTVSGNICISTKWTTSNGMTVCEIEDHFLNGDADPMDPQHEPLLNALRSHYTRMNMRATSYPHDGRARTRASVAARLKYDPGTSLSSHHELRPQCGAETERLRRLRRRWHIRKNNAEPRNAEEASLLFQPIPLDSMHCPQRSVVNGGGMGHGVGEEVEMSSDCPSLFFSISPLSRKEKLKVWQKCLLIRKSDPCNAHMVEDHKIQERHVIVPKLLPSKPIHWTAQSRLNPRREKRPKVGRVGRDSSAALQDSRIVVHIMRASTLPVRLDGTPLEPFVEVSFVYETLHSRSEVGSTPSWFETLSIPFSPPDFDDDTLSLIDDDIVICVYDKVEVPMPSTTVIAGAVSHETHYRTERRLLGTLRIPFYSLYTANRARLEGPYVLSTPQWTLGYDPSPREIAIDGSSGVRLRRHGSPSPFPMLQLYVALWPRPGRSLDGVEEGPKICHLAKQFNVSAQLQHLHGAAVEWRRRALVKIGKLSSVNPVACKRCINSFVFCTTGDLTLVCRYLLPGGGPPPITLTTVKQVIRFVSLLPLRIDMLPQRGHCVLNTNVELLRSRNGRYEELSFLLVHFLRFIEPSEATYVVSGRGPIYQRVTMVLHSFGGELRLIDPHTGAVAPVHDPNFNFFDDIHTVISHDQLWANIQISGAPHRMNWNLHDKRFWSPCFDHEDECMRSCLPFMAPLQRETLQFKLRDTEKEREIEQQLRKAVRHALVEWRNGRRPAFHNSLGTVLEKLLEDVENEKSGRGNATRDKVNRRAAKVLNEYLGEKVMHDSQQHQNLPCASPSVVGSNPPLRMAGSPVNGAFMSHDRGYRLILRQVFETAVHEAAANDISFAVAVYVRGYTSEVYSMWVFLAAIYRI